MLFASIACSPPLWAHVGVALPGLLQLGGAMRPVPAHVLFVISQKNL